MPRSLLEAHATFNLGDGWFAGLGAGIFGTPWSRAQALQVQGRVGHLLRLSSDCSAQLA